MIDIKKYCSYLYTSLYIPIYLYDNKELVACYPNQETSTYPTLNYLSNLWETENEVSYKITKFYSYYGCIKLKNSNSCMIIGPISPLPYTRDIIFKMHKEFLIVESKSEIFNTFFCNIPLQNIDSFLNILLFINYTVNNSELTRKDVEHSMDSPLHQSFNRKYYENSFASKEEGIINSNYEAERELFRYIETGNIVGVENFLYHSVNTKPGIIADNNLRQLKNTFIVTVTLAVRAAMKGGLTSSIAYQLSDTYIQQVERLTDMDAIQSLLLQVIYDYTNRTANSIIPQNADNVLHKVVKYVRENSNKKIMVADVAEYVGFNRSYLSRKFKNELGFDLSKLILRCKLEEAKDLLTYSKKSISEISNFLCFSSQSHFQKTFKQQYSITPQTYRKSV